MKSCLAEPTTTEVLMPGGVIFEYKCPTKGHVTTKRHPPGTAYGAYSHILCPECLKVDKVVRAYIIFACPEKSTNYGGSGS